MHTEDVGGVDRAVLRRALEHVVWIGGGSGAGKSTVARRLAAEHSLRRYSTDDAMSDHAARCTPTSAPQLHEFTTMTMDERWVTRSPQTMLETFHWFGGEGFALVVEDLLALPRAPRVVAEGFRLLPHLVAPLLTEPAQAVWLLPTPAFRRAAFDARGSLWSIAGRTSDPPRALQNLLERDRLFTDRLALEVRRLGLDAVQVDTATTEDELLARVRAVLRL